MKPQLKIRKCPEACSLLRTATFLILLHVNSSGTLGANATTNAGAVDAMCLGTVTPSPKAAHSSHLGKPAGPLVPVIMIASNRADQPINTQDSPIITHQCWPVCCPAQTVNPLPAPGPLHMTSLQATMSFLEKATQGPFSQHLICL